MRFLIVTLMMVSASMAQAKVEGFNEMIQEASVSEKILRKKLLKILNSSQMAIATHEPAETELQKSPSQDFEVRLVKTQ